VVIIALKDKAMDEVKRFLLSRLKSILRKRYRKKHTNDEKKY
jgi:hypothetical protein